VSQARDLDRRLGYWVNQVDGLADSNREQITRTLSRSINQTLRDLKTAYGKFSQSEGATNAYTIQSQTARYRELLKASETLFDASTRKQIQSIYERDLNEAYETGGAAAQDLARITDANKSITDNTKMPTGAQLAAGSRLNAFWDKETAALRNRVTEATLGALQRGKGWSAASREIAEALRSNGQTILRGNDELSVTARNGIVMNLQQRADLIARTELASAYIEGQMAQYRRDGYTHGRWSATGERSCPFCASREGAIYTLDELDGAIPAHPRCRCTVAPVLGESINRVMRANDRAAAAAEWLDDAGWTAIRQQRISEYLKFTGKSQLDVAKWQNTPTNRERYLKGPQAKPAKPAWNPSGKVQPDLKAAEEAAERAKQQVTPQELTPEESIVADVMQDTRFKTDAQRIREMRVRFKKAGLSTEQDWVALAADARGKGAFSKEAKAERKDLNKQQQELEKAEELKKQDELNAKKAEEKQALKETRAGKNGELKVIDSELKPLNKQIDALKSKRDYLAAERTEIRDAQREVENAQKRQEIAVQEKGQVFLKKAGINNQIQTAKEKLANLKPGKKGEEFDLKQYDIEIANQNHTMDSLKKIGEDVLRRAGVTMTEVKTPSANGAGSAIEAAEAQITRAKIQLEGWKKNAARSRKNIKTIKSNEEYAISRAQREFEAGRIGGDALDTKIRMIKENTRLAIENEEKYLARVPKAVEEWELKQKQAEVDLKAAQNLTRDSAAQKVIDELVSTSPLTRAQAKALVEEAAKTNRIAEGKRKNVIMKTKLRPVPSDGTLDPMIDAVHMYGTRSSMDVYGLSSERAHAHTRRPNRLDGSQVIDYDGKLAVGYVNSGQNYGDWRGTQFHELGHHLEFMNTDFYRASREFIDSRKSSPDAKPKWLGGNYGRNEIGYEGKAYSRYVLKEYDLNTVQNNQTYAPAAVKDIVRKEAFGWLNGTDYTSLHQRFGLATEVTSMGVEKLSSATNLQRLAEQDSEHLLLALGMVKVQQARARVGIDRFDRVKDKSTPVVTAKDVPNGVQGGGDTKAQSQRLKSDISKLEKELKDVEALAKAASKAVEDTTSESFKALNSMSKLRSMEQNRAEQEGIEDSLMNLQIERSPLLKQKRELEEQIKQLDENLRKLEG